MDDEDERDRGVDLEMGVIKTAGSFKTTVVTALGEDAGEEEVLNNIGVRAKGMNTSSFPPFSS